MKIVATVHGSSNLVGVLGMHISNRCWGVKKVAPLKLSFIILQAQKTIFLEPTFRVTEGGLLCVK